MARRGAQLSKFEKRADVLGRIYQNMNRARHSGDRRAFSKWQNALKRESPSYKLWHGKKRNPRRRDKKRGRPQMFTRPPSERDWRGYRLVKLALRVNPSSMASTRIIRRALKDIRHREVLSPTMEIPWQLRQAREELKKRLERRNPRRRNPSRVKVRHLSGDKAHSGNGWYWQEECEHPRGPFDTEAEAHDHASHTRQARRELKKNLERRFSRRRNPKRDGTPTRGELRKVKYVHHLKKLAELGQEARGTIARLTSTLTKPESGIFEPLGKRVLHRAEIGPSHHHEIPQQAAPVVASLPAHPEAANIHSRIGDIDMLIKDMKEQLRELGDSDDTETEQQVVLSEIEKFARQKKALRDKLESLSTATNPRRRRGRDRRMSPARARALVRCSRQCATSIRRVRSYLRQCRRRH